MVETLTLSPHNLLTEGRIITIVTAGFIHHDFLHLFSNIVGIYIFGSIVERKFGIIRTFLVYFGALIISMGVSVLIYTYVLDKNVAIIGASGALMGLISCAMLIEPFGRVIDPYVPIPVMFAAWAFVYADTKGLLGGEKGGISHVAHLVGFLSIALVVYLLDKKDRDVLFRGLLINIISFAAFISLWWYLGRS